MQLPWMPGMNVGVHMMDAKHRQLFEMMHELGSSLEYGNASGARVLVDEYISAAEEHFIEEEVAMARHRYPHADSHMAEHRVCLQLLRDVRAAIAAGHLYQAGDWLAEYVERYFNDMIRHDCLLGNFLTEMAPDEDGEIT